MKYKIFKYGGRWYSFCPHCSTVRNGLSWHVAMAFTRIHAEDHNLLTRQTPASKL